MRAVLFAVLLLAIPSYSQCYDHYSLTSQCRDELAEYHDRGLRAPRGVWYGARRESMQQDIQDTRIEALKAMKSDLEELEPDDTRREALEDKLDRKIRRLEYGFE